MRTVLSLLIFSFMVSCSPFNGLGSVERIDREIAEGNFRLATEMIDSLLVRAEGDGDLAFGLMAKRDSLHRVRLDFNRSVQEVVDWIEEHQGVTPTDSMLAAWERAGSLEYRVIDGEKRYFRNAAPNVFRVDASARALTQAAAPKTDTPRDELLVEAFSNRVKSGVKGKYLLPPQTVRYTYTLSLRNKQGVPGDSLRVWLPFPRKDIERQTGVVLVGTSHPDYLLSGDRTVHASIYMEDVIQPDESPVFHVEFEATSRGEWFDLEEIDVQPYRVENDMYRHYTAERAPHVVFSDRIKQVTDSVTKEARTPVEILRSVYRYIAGNYPWASALEYSTIPNIPEYALTYRKGDCGQVALLLITMLRYKGIPARWQSGWMTHPGDLNLHDWAEVYFEGTGWVPVDISFGRGAPIPIEPGREFFMSGIDSYRLYINSDFSGSFYPEKKFPRSETVDFQRGEVESSRWNLYFDGWSYKMEVSYQ